MGIKKTVLALVFFMPLAAPTVQAQSSSKDAALETIGGASGALLYNSYTTLGILADAYGMEAYESDFTIQILDEQIAIYVEMKSQYQNLLDSGFLDDANDRDFTRDIIHGLELLTDEARALKNFVATEGEGEDTDFQESRQAAWDKIAGLLGIE